jgi:hypothetical protein
MAKRKSGISAKKAPKKAKAKGTVRQALEKIVSGGKAVLKKAAARRARRQAAVVALIAGGTSLDKKMKARAVKKTTAAKASRG